LWSAEVRLGSVNALLCVGKSATPPQVQEIVGWVFEHGDWRCEDCSVFTKPISFQRSCLGALYDSATVDPCSYNVTRDTPELPADTSLPTHHTR
jgi:hypothetical protein